MKNIKKHRKEHASRKLKIMRLINVGLIIFMFIVVIYDSFVHYLPFYYILFFFVGYVIGSLVSRTQRFQLNEASKILTVESHPLGISIMLFLLFVRLFIGKLILLEFHVLYATDALYLLFIGIYFAKIKAMIKQMDKRVYDRFFEQGRDIN